MVAIFRSENSGQNTHLALPSRCMSTKSRARARLFRSHNCLSPELKTTRSLLKFKPFLTLLILNGWSEFVDQGRQYPSKNSRTLLRIKVFVDNKMTFFPSAYFLLALSISCYFCLSTTSWEDCRNTLSIKNCSHIHPEMVCATETMKETDKEKKVTHHYRKICEDPQMCNSTQCQDVSCDVRCCDKDFCNKDIATNISSIHDKNLGGRVFIGLFVFLMSLTMQD